MDNQNRELPQNAIIYVAKPRSGYFGDYATVQEAIDAIPICGPEPTGKRCGFRGTSPLSH